LLDLGGTNVSVQPVLMRTVLALATVVSAAPALLVPPRASAAVEVSVESGVLLVNAEGSELNIVDIRFEHSAYQVWSATSGLAVGSNCFVSGFGRAICVGEIGSATIRGSDGEDVINLSGVPVPVDGQGGAGDDALNGGVLRSTLSGGPGVDGLMGSGDDDWLDGGDDDDLLVGRDGQDVEFGGDADDILDGGAGSGDTLTGNAGDDLLNGGPGNDTLQGDSGGDVLVGGRGKDSLTPGAGQDAVFLGSTGRDTVQCPLTVSLVRPLPLSCARVGSGTSPDTWPPPDNADPRAPTPNAALSDANAHVFKPRHARYVEVRIPDSKKRKVHVCIRPYNSVGTALHRYTGRTYTKYWLKVQGPDPPKKASFATAARGSC
jgi:hypothetical protein